MLNQDNSYTYFRAPEESQRFPVSTQVFLPPSLLPKFLPPGQSLTHSPRILVDTHTVSKNKKTHQTSNIHVIFSTCLVLNCSNREQAAQKPTQEPSSVNGAPHSCHREINNQKTNMSNTFSPAAESTTKTSSKNWSKTNKKILFRQTLKLL